MSLAVGAATVPLVWQIVLGVIAAGGVSAAVTFWLGRHKPAIDRKMAQQAEQKTISAIRTEDIENLRKITQAQDNRINRLEERLERAEARAAEAEGRLERAEARADAAEHRAKQAEDRARREAAYVDILLDHWHRPPDPPPRPPHLLAS